MTLAKPSKLAFALLSSASILLSACSDSDNTTAQSNDPLISGSVFASYVSGASVSVTDEAGNTLAGPVTSNAQGEFDLNIPAEHLNSNLIFKAIGGVYSDEASEEISASTTANSSLSAFIKAGTLADSATPQFSLSPASTIIRQLITEHGLSHDVAMTRFSDAFGYTHAPSVLPIDARDSSGDDTKRQLAGLRAAAFSQLTADLGLSPSAQGLLLNQLATDLADGEMDGMENGLTELGVIDNGNSSPVSLGKDIQGRFAQAMINFRAGGKDNSGLNNASIGVLPFSKIAISDNYIVTYVPGSMAAMQGRTNFSLQVTDHDGNPVSGLTPTLAPLMHMAAHNHSTPFIDVSEDSETSGTYNARVYYLMASTMGNGASMGYWEIKVNLGTDSVTFYPKVMMAMEDTARVNLKSQTDQVGDMMGASKRSYILFKHQLKAMNNTHDFSVFIAAKESMMSFPAIENGMTLNAGSMYELQISDIDVKMSTDQNTWIDASADGKGVWTASGLTGLTNGQQDSIYVQLSVNNEQKTDDGNAPDGTDDEAEFLVTPSAMTM